MMQIATFMPGVLLQRILHIQSQDYLHGLEGGQGEAHCGAAFAIHDYGTHMFHFCHKWKI